MKVGDTIIDNKNQAWIVFDFTTYEGEDLLCVTDVKTQKENELVRRDDVSYVIPKPKNLTHLFIKRREKNLDVEIKGYLK